MCELPNYGTLRLVCHEILDLDNLGTSLRSAASSGVQTVIFTFGGADLWGLKGLRSGMGAQFRIQIQPSMDWSDITYFAQDAALCHYVATGAMDDIGGTGGTGDMAVCSDVDWRKTTTLVIGSEAEGA